MKERIISVCLIISMLILLAACSPDTIGIRGKVTSVSENGETMSMLVEGSVTKDTTFDKASVSVTKDTAIIIRENNVDKPGDKSAIKEGATVEVVFTGEVAESYPVQGTAKKVIILS